MTNIKTEVATSVFRATTLQNFQRMMSAGPARVQAVHSDVNMLAGGCSRSLGQSRPADGRRRWMCRIRRWPGSMRCWMRFLIVRRRRRPAGRSQFSRALRSGATIRVRAAAVKIQSAAGKGSEERRTLNALWFHGFKVSWFHPNRDRDRYRDRLSA